MSEEQEQDDGGHAGHNHTPKGERIAIRSMILSFRSIPGPRVAIPFVGKAYTHIGQTYPTRKAGEQTALSIGRSFLGRRRFLGHLITRLCPCRTMGFRLVENSRLKVRKRPF